MERKARRGHAEEQIQAAVVLHLSRGTRNAGEAGRFKALGVKAGVPDLLVLRAGQLYGLELKAPGGRLSDAQREMLAELQAAGAQTAVEFGLDEALSTLERWGVIRGSRSSGNAAALSEAV